MISSELVDEVYSDKAERTYAKPTEYAPDGVYTMAIRGIYGKATSTGTTQAKILFVHTDENSELYKPSYFTLSKTKDGGSNTPGSDRALLAIARTFGLSKEEAATIDFQANGSEAVITFQADNGQPGEIVLGGELLSVKLKTREYTASNGEQRAIQEAAYVNVVRE
jgi:hypothetical protein